MITKEVYDDNNLKYFMSIYDDKIKFKNLLEIDLFYIGEQVIHQNQNELIYHTYMHRLQKPLRTGDVTILFSKNVGDTSYEFHRILHFFLNDDIFPFVLDKKNEALILFDYSDVFPSLKINENSSVTTSIDDYEIINSVEISEIYLFSKKKIENDIKCLMLIS